MADGEPLCAEDADGPALPLEEEAEQRRPAPVAPDESHSPDLLPRHAFEDVAVVP